MKLTLTAVAIATLATNLVQAAHFYGHQKCINLGIRRGHWLHANCHYDSGRWLWNEVDLNEIVTNDNGQLKFQDKGAFGYGDGCQGCNIEPGSAWLNCECKNIDGNYARTRLDLQFGPLVYNDIEKGRVCLEKTRNCGHGTQGPASGPGWHSHGSPYGRKFRA